MWQEGIFAFDANVLLNVYRYTEATQQRLLDILKQLQSQIWVPYQAALEYQEQRSNVISKQLDAYDELEEQIQTHFQKAQESARAFRRHTILGADRLIEETVQDAFEQVKATLQELRRKHPNFLASDSLHENIADLFEDRVGAPYSSEQLEDIYKQAEERFRKQTPPGYKDSKKEGLRQYGDVVVWFQLLDYASAQKKPILFVTDDQKDDWWIRHQGKTIGPRSELIQEMSIRADVSFYMYSTDQFMNYAEQYLALQEQPAAIREVQEIRQEDEANQHLQEVFGHDPNLYAGISPFPSQVIESLAVDITPYPRSYADLINSTQFEAWHPTATTNEQLYAMFERIRSPNKQGRRRRTKP
jgi:hypothetical protein